MLEQRGVLASSKSSFDDHQLHPQAPTITNSTLHTHKSHYAWLTTEEVPGACRYVTLLPIFNEPSTDLKTAGPMMPFFAAGLIIMYGVNAGQNAMMASEYCSLPCLR